MAASRTPAPGAGSRTTAPTPGFLPEVRDGSGGVPSPIALVLLLGSMSVLPGILIMTTAFTRIVIVLGFVRSALGTQGVPPNQVLIGLAMFLTFFVMGPVFSEANEQALQPFLREEITQGQAFDRALEPFRGFMLDNVREKDLALFVELSGEGPYAQATDTPTTTLVPAYVISELRAAFLIGFVVFVPFIVIDLVVSAALSAMGMAMLPPSMISLPFKLLLFVAVDGWFLLVTSLVRSFNV
ncbi:MAG: flagellar type III secretion system pore protein FliP [Actinomycetota bacterium]|nr:flagellar type III secretion system pore protein FliP [Actinomycetota bacterium]